MDLSNRQLRIEWVGQFVVTLMMFGFLYIIIRMVDGPGHRPTLAMPLGYRVALFGVVVIATTTMRVWMANRRARRRSR